ncbi:MAG: hypothetical protein KJN90_00105, partial [Gammaproteobacteria bacterium]|nr:hypothetical protein [Gammaproteobacteria bacterium]
MSSTQPGKPATNQPINTKPGGPALNKMSRLALILAWIVLLGTVLLEVLNRLRIYLGYEPFDSQWGLIGLLSLFGFILIFFLALFQFVVCAIGLVLAQRNNNQVDGKRFRLALAINLVGFALF